jgi:putative ABC transport system permease protein
MSTLRYAIRTLIKSPGFSAIAIGTIALGIAANSAIFSVVNALLLRPLPFRDEGRIVRVLPETKDERRSNHSAGEFLDLKRDNRTLQAMAGFRGELAAVAAPPGAPLQLGLHYVTPEFFDVLEVAPRLGRLFTGTDGAIAGEPQVVIGDDAWTKLLSRDPGAVGRRVRVNGEWCTVVAVLPKGAEWPEGTDVWMRTRQPVPPSPLNLKQQDPLANRDSHYFEAIARLKPGVTLEQARQDLKAVMVVLQQQHPDDSGGREMRLIPFREDMIGDVRDALIVIQAAVGLVLLIACANVSSLLIARATGRRRELAIRAALGASRGDLVRQLLLESVVLGGAGGAIGLMVSSWLVAVLVKVIPGGVPRTQSIHVDGFVLAATIVASLVTGVLFGILPAFQASRTDAAQALKQSGDRGSSRTHGRAALVVAEIALTLVLLVGAGLLGNSFLRLQRVDSGFTVDHATVAELMVPQTRYPKGADQARIYRRLVEALSSRPEVQAVGVGFPGPLRGSNASASFYIEGRQRTGRADKPFANVATVSGGYFKAMGLRLIGGRTFDDRDREEAPPAVIVNATFAKQYWPGQDPVGKRLRFDDDPKEPWATVVGTVTDARQLGLKQPAPPILYLPFEQFVLPFTTVNVRSTLPEPAIASLLKSQLAAIDPDLPFGDINPLEQDVTGDVAEPRFRAVLIGIFALLALVLAAVGVYGLISYTVTQQTREIGIRVALGAAPSQVILPTLRTGVVLAMTGIGFGLVGAYIAGRALSAFLFGVQPGDPLTFAGVATLLLLVAAAASYIPSRRALKVDPIIALRAE